MTDGVKAMKCLQKYSLKNKSTSWLLIGCAVILLLAVLASLCIGSSFLSPHRILGAIADSSTMDGKIFWHIRLPRTLACLLAGSALSVAGSVIQVLLNNPMAGPSIIGVNAGAGLGVVVAIAFFPKALMMPPLGAFLGAFGAMLLVYGIARKIQASHTTLILAGMAVNAFLNAGIDIVTMLVPDILTSNHAFRNGGVAGLTLGKLFPGWILIPLCLFVVYFLGRELDIIGLGEDTAKSLGMQTERVRFLFLLLSAALAGIAISFAGLLSFVGLVVPHIVRAFVGSESQKMIPAAAILGGAFLVICDVLARSLFSPYELPVGILLSLLGGPFFIYLLARRYRHV